MAAGSCCNGSPATQAATQDGKVASNGDATYTDVQEYYGKVLSTSKDLKTSACTAAGRPHQLVVDSLRRIPAEVLDKFYGCGAPLPLGVTGTYSSGSYCFWLLNLSLFVL